MIQTLIKCVMPSCLELILRGMFEWQSGCVSLSVPMGSPSRTGNVAVYIFDINQLSLPTAFYSVLVSVSVFMALSTVFHCINSPNNSFTCHWGNTRVERTPNESQQIKLTLEKKILPPLLPRCELATFRSRVPRSYQQAILPGDGEEGEKRVSRPLQP